MKWIWIRHGETDINAQGRYLGHLDAPLNERGRKQAKDAAQLLKGTSIDTIYSSDLKRCVETAAILSDQGNVEPIRAASLRELHFGAWEGLTYEEIVRSDSAQAEAWYANPYENAPPGGETLAMLGARVDRWLSSLPKDGTVALVSHGGVIRWFQSQWLLGDSSRFWDVPGLAHGACFAAQWDGRSWSVLPSISYDEEGLE